MPSAILIDIDNTVYPYDPCHASGVTAAHLVGASIHHRWQDTGEFVAAYQNARDIVKSRTGGTGASHSRLLYFKTMLEVRSGRTNADATIALHDAYWKGYFSRMRCDPGCADLLAHLRDRGVLIAWVSDFTTELQLRKLRTLGLEHAADLLVTSEEAGADKPSPAVVTLALQALGAHAADTWLVGDDPVRDLGAARASGVAGIWFNRAGAAPMTDVPAKAVVKDWFELRGLCDSAPI